MFTPNQMAVLSLLTSQPAKEFHMSEIGRVLGKPAGTFQRGLNSLVEHGYLRSRKQGNMRLFSANREHPLFPEVRAIVAKTCGVEGRLRSAVQPISGITLALIYGSYVKDRMRPDSDIDVLVVCSQRKAEDVLLAKLAAIERAVQREINYKLYRNDQFRKMVRTGDPFLANVLHSDFILLKGAL